MKKNKLVKKKHRLFLELVRIPCNLIFRWLYGYKRPKMEYLSKNENVFILSNHQTDYDPILISMAFNKPIYYVCSDSVFSSFFGRLIVGKCFGAIPKKKAVVDPKCIKSILTIIKEKGSIGLFPEGNRSYAEFQFFINNSVVKLIKASKMPLILYNLHGGNGIMPRFAKHKRKGPYYGEIKKKILPEEYEKMTDDELFSIIKENLKVYDSESNQNYYSKKRAEYLERMLFVCPCCQSVQTLYSKNEFLYCRKCSLKVEYTPNLHLKSENEKFTFAILNDWYEFQKKWCRELNYNDIETIFIDKKIKIYETTLRKRRKLIHKGTIKLTNKELIFEGNQKQNIFIKNITIASVIGGRKFNFSTLDKDYLVVGHQRFNPLKYVLIFNQLDTHMKEKGNDKYYTIT